MLAVALGLGSSLCWGLADFLGGVQARRVPLAAVMLVSQAVGLLVVVGVVVAVGDAPPAGNALLYAALGGAAGVLALSAFYHALAIGTMSVVAPISATGAAVPVLVGLAAGDRPSAFQLAGIAAVVVGVVLASREAHEDLARASAARASVLLALVAALGFGTFFVGLDAATDESVAWAMVAARSAGFGLLAVGLLALRPRLAITPADVPALALVGALDVSANGLIALATTEGLLSVVSVLGSLYPVTTVLLAWAVLHERVRRVQAVGIVVALGGVVLIAGG